MKSFLEEYGMIVVAAIVILVLVVAAPSIGSYIIDSIQPVFEKAVESK